MQDSVALYNGLFNDCNQLTSITINDYTAPSLVVFGELPVSSLTLAGHLLFFSGKSFLLVALLLLLLLIPVFGILIRRDGKRIKMPSGKRKTGGGCHIFEKVRSGLRTGCRSNWK